MPGIPRIGFSWVDARDVADLQIRAMIEPAAGGERFIAVDRFMWMSEVAEVIRSELGDEATKVPTRSVPSFLVRAMAIFDPSIRGVVGQLGVRREYSSEKARTMLGWSPRPSEETVVDTARSILARP
jgi:dihydroflavonol-4-reductase